MPAVMNAPRCPSLSEASHTQLLPSGYGFKLTKRSPHPSALERVFRRNRSRPNVASQRGHTGTSAPALGRMASVNRTSPCTPPSASTTWFSAHIPPPYARAATSPVWTFWPPVTVAGALPLNGANSAARASGTALACASAHFVERSLPRARSTTRVAGRAWRALRSTFTRQADHECGQPRRSG